MSSAAWIKELLLDYGLNRLAIDQKNDIASAIDGLIKSRALATWDIQILDLYISGYTSEEIANTFVFSVHNYITALPTEDIESILARVILAIATASGYTDDLIIRRAKENQIRTKVPKFITFLQQHSTTYMEHDL